MMTNFRNLVALTATAAVVAASYSVVAQDDYDELEEGLGTAFVDTDDEPGGEAPSLADEPDAVADDDSLPDIADIADLEDDGGEPPAIDSDEPGDDTDEPAVDDTDEPGDDTDEPSVDDTDEPGNDTDEPAVADTDEPAVDDTEEPGEEPDEPAVDDTDEPAGDDTDEPGEEPDEPAVADTDEPAGDDTDEPGEPVGDDTDDPGEPAGDDTDEPAEPEGDDTDEPSEPSGDDTDEPGDDTDQPDDVPGEPKVPAVAVTDEPAAVDTDGSVADRPASRTGRPNNPRGVQSIRGQTRVADGLSDEERELLDLINAWGITEALSLNSQAEREMAVAKALFKNEQFYQAAKHYALALRNIDRGSPLFEEQRAECEKGIAEGLYQAALQEDALGSRTRALKIIEKAINHKHPKAKRQKAMWEAEGNPDAGRKTEDEVRHVRDTKEYEEMRAKNNQHLARAQQYLGLGRYKEADDECGLVLISDPNNREAMSLRRVIQKKRQTRYKTEREATRDGMIADVDKAWQPIYAIDVREVETVKAGTTGTPKFEKDPERAQEQVIVKKMKDMRLPAISFKPPATIIDAVEFFRSASKDFDSPELPFEERGFNFILRTPEALRSAAPAAENDEGGFTEDVEEAEGSSQAGVPVIPMITASNISFYEALKLVCESVDYKFKVQGKMVVVMHKSMTTSEMTWRNYPAPPVLIERVGSVSEDIREMGGGNGFGGGGGGGGDGEQSQEQDWKRVFEELGVSWPEGSSIRYFKTLGKLRVRNTYENLAEIEQALNDLGAAVALIEIETRFVEVCQEDLNSLGFEWILNSDYTLNLSRHAGRLLGVRSGAFSPGSPDGSSGGAAATGPGTVTVGGVTATTGLSGGTTSVDPTTQYVSTQGASWVRNPGAKRNVGISSMGGESAYGGTTRYLSTLSNHISGGSASTNDQFMKVNAFLGGADISMILHMLNQRSDTDLLSAPKVLTKPGEEAVMKVVTEFIYPTDYNVQLQQGNNGGNWNNNGGGGGGPSAIAIVEPESFTMREVGVILDVTPTLTDDGNLIELDLSTTVVDEPTWKNYGMRIPFSAGNNVNFEGIGDILTGLSEVLETLGTGLTDTVRAAFAQTAVDSATKALDSLTQNTSENMTYFEAPMEQPFFHVRQVQSKLTIYPGATVVMGGLITEQRKAMDDKVPFLGDLPFIGRLFRSHSEQTRKRNLLIFVTARKVDTQGRELRFRDDSGAASEQAAVAPAPSVAED